MGILAHSRATDGPLCLPGDARLSVVPSDGPPPLPLEPGLHPSMIDRTSAVNEDGYRSERWVYAPASDELTRIFARSTDFDTTLRVLDAQGRHMTFNDDYSESSTDAMVQFLARAGERYTIEVSTYSPGEQGGYTLYVYPFDTDKPRQMLTDQEAVTGTLRAGGAGPGMWHNADSLFFEARGGERIRLRVTSAEIDTMAYLHGPDGTVWFNDDAHDTGPDGTESIFDSTIETMAPADGVYHVIVESFGGETGSYRAQLTRTPPVLLGVDGSAPESGYAGTELRGRVRGVFVGISHYRSSPLFGCADDAIFLADAFEHRGLVDGDDVVVITDSAATIATVTKALRYLAEQSQPEDLVVIFFSGHGNTMAAEDDTTELNGLDETLVFFDGEMRDHDFVALLDPIQSDTMILAIDACMSGGFAHDFMTQPGRIGLFSSDFDVLSNVARPLGAGGYLSLFLREAVVGYADSRPGEGILTAGELTDYIVDRYAQYHATINPPGSHAPRQRAVIDRGSVSWETPLWIFPRAADGAAIEHESVQLVRGVAASMPVQSGGTCR